MGRRCAGASRDRARSRTATDHPPSALAAILRLVVANDPAPYLPPSFRASPDSPGSNSWRDRVATVRRSVKVSAMLDGPMARTWISRSGIGRIIHDVCEPIGIHNYHLTVLRLAIMQCEDYDRDDVTNVMRGRAGLPISSIYSRPCGNCSSNH
jgi:hypothetical protein